MFYLAKGQRKASSRRELEERKKIWMVLVRGTREREVQRFAFAFSEDMTDL